MAISGTYCTHTELKRIFPQISEYDSKKPIYGWELGLTDWYDTSLDIYFAHNTGLVDKLFFNGSELDEITYSTSSTVRRSLVDDSGGFNPDNATFTVDDGDIFGANDIIKVDNENSKRK